MRDAAIAGYEAASDMEHHSRGITSCSDFTDVLKQNVINANLRDVAVDGDIILRSQPKWASCPNDGFRVTARRINRRLYCLCVQRR